MLSHIFPRVEANMPDLMGWMKDSCFPERFTKNMNVRADVSENEQEAHDGTKNI